MSASVWEGCCRQQFGLEQMASLNCLPAGREHRKLMVSFKAPNFRDKLFKNGTFGHFTDMPVRLYVEACARGLSTGWGLESHGADTSA